MGYTNSPLVVYTKLSPNHSGQRTHLIDRITPHCVVGSYPQKASVPASRQDVRQAAITASVRTAGWPYVWRRRTALGVPPVMSMTREQSRLSAPAIGQSRMR